MAPHSGHLNLDLRDSDTLITDTSAWALNSGGVARSTPPFYFPVVILSILFRPICDV
jgi:hypothetical protein